MGACFRDRLRSNETLVGTLVTLPCLESAEILAERGFDWLFIDLEHSALGTREAQAIQQVVAGRAACVLRVPLNDEVWIKKALDTGAAGLMIPQVNSADDARRAARWSKYPPEGVRSVGMARAGGYGTRQSEYLARANAETALIVQAENIRAVENIEEILAVEAVDGVLVGPYDLSASMGLTGQVEHVDVQSAIERVRAACTARGLAAGIFATRAERASAYRADGYRLIAVGSDTLMLGQRADETLNLMRFAY